MLNNSYFNFFIGFSIGNMYGKAKHAEAEIKQGKNYYLASLPLMGQSSMFLNVVSIISNTFPPSPLNTLTKMGCNIIPLFNLALFPAFAAVKEGHYEVGANLYNNTGFSNKWLKLPQKLGAKTVTCVSFLTEHLGDIFSVAMLAGSVALIALGKAPMGYGLLTGVGYEVLEGMGYLPHKVKLFGEKYLSKVLPLGALLGGTWISRVMVVLTFASQWSSCGKFLQQKVDQVIRKVVLKFFSKIPGFSIAEIDAPWKKKTEMTFDEIKTILKMSHEEFDAQYKINPAHFSKLSVDIEKIEHLPVNSKFDKFFELFKKTDWKSKYNLIKNKLKDDERFLDYLQTQFPKENFKFQIKIETEKQKSELVNKTPEEMYQNYLQKQEDDKAAYKAHQQKIESHMIKLAEKNGKTKEEFFAAYMENQMKGLVKSFNGQGNVKGSSIELQDAIDRCRWILPYLTKLNDQVELEDILLKLTVEGGEYCAKGVKRASEEIFWAIMQSSTIELQNQDPIEQYEFKVLQALQTHRIELAQVKYKELLKDLPISANKITTDVHIYDNYQFYFLGFIPVSDFTRNLVGLALLPMWEVYSAFREELYFEYNADFYNIFKKMKTDAQFMEYIEKVFNANKSLNPEQIEILKNVIAEWEFEGEEWTGEDTMKRFQRLFFIRTGLLVSA